MRLRARVPSFTFALVALVLRQVAADSLLDKEFCQLYYPNGNSDYPPCEQVKAQVRVNMSRPLPTLELGDPSQPGMFFIHGWPDSAAEWAPQFAHFCFSGRFYCVAATWQNFHPDVAAAPDAHLKFNVQIEKLAATMRAAELKDTTLVIHDWGAFIGYQMMPRYPELISRVVAFDIGNSIPNMFQLNLTYQAENRKAWAAQDSSPAVGSAKYWEAPCIHCATWQSSWPYVFTLSLRNLIPVLPGHLGPAKPLIFFWGNMTRGKPRGADTKFFSQSWLNYVNALPHGQVVEVPSDHWMHLHVPGVCNKAIDTWLGTLPETHTKNIAV